MGIVAATGKGNSGHLKQSIKRPGRGPVTEKRLYKEGHACYTRPPNTLQYRKKPHGNQHIGVFLGRRTGADPQALLSTAAFGLLRLLFGVRGCAVFADPCGHGTHAHEAASHVGTGPHAAGRTSPTHHLHFMRKRTGQYCLVGQYGSHFAHVFFRSRHAMDQHFDHGARLVAGGGGHTQNLCRHLSYGLCQHPVRQDFATLDRHYHTPAGGGATGRRSYHHLRGWRCHQAGQYFTSGRISHTGGRRRGHRYHRCHRAHPDR